MKKKLKNLYRFLAGDERLFQFEHRVFNLSSFVIVVFCIQGTLINYLLGLHMATVWLAIGGTLISAFLFFVARVKRIFTPALVTIFAVATILILAPLHFFNGASEGPVIYLLIMMLNIFLLIARSRQQYLVYGIFTVSIMTMLWLEYKYPELIVPYKNIDQRIADHATVLAYSVFFTALVIWLFRRSYDREQQIIKDQKRELEKAYTLTTEKNKYIESLIRELHHRVKNNLQVVSSLMSLQSNRLEDDKARQALEEGKTRVDAMAMIHQKLYMDNELAAVDISEYLLNLSASLAHSHGYDAGHISTAVNLSNRYVDIDIAIPVGLIVNELVTNAFKHAFNGIQDPKITIELTGNNGGFELSVCDNGRGIGVVGDHPWSFGMKLVYMLVEQLDARMEVDTKKGTSYLIKISA